ncbi:GntR family transcriptional regulator [Paramicrobacterium agarici]|uniref:DNA-binding GntR family transcriptional regulator n=1 Tax=Paramicrobacterium agarici TaxID=630514 RepID=A0A2A9DTV4_9MICO|nr:GntR family transcriptional regulator [Microbacterium agarici]PFG30033.1 DNA-binding GntR family transcriptional regulator [Microbacterium agarici]
MPNTETAQRHDGTYVTDELRRAITAGELAPNQRLIEADLTEQYEASRGAVRLALANLAAEGLIERIQNRGSRVRAIDLDEALEIVELRAALESICAAKAAERADDAGIARLKAIGERMRNAVEEGDTETYSAGNKELHELILRLSAMKVAPGVVSRLRAQNVRYRIRLARHHNRPTVSLPEHLEIIEAISNHDAPRAAAAMETHLKSVLEATRTYFS